MIESGYSKVEADTFLTLIDRDANGCIETQEFIDSVARYNEWVEDYGGEEVTPGELFEEFINGVISSDGGGGDGGGGLGGDGEDGGLGGFGLGGDEGDGGQLEPTPGENNEFEMLFPAY
jgi:hypothetical protein